MCSSDLNPEAAAYYNALAQQEKEIAMNADQYGRQRTLYGIDLMSNAPNMFNLGYAPISSSLGFASQVEGMGQQPLSLSSELAGRQSTAGANAGQFLYAGGANAARTLQGANQYSVPGAALTAFGTSPQAVSWFDRIITNNSNKGLSYNPGAGYGTGTAYGNMTPDEISNMQQWGV